MKVRRFQVFWRGVRSAIDPSMAVRRRGVMVVSHYDPNEALCEDWYTVGSDLRGAAKKFEPELRARRERRVSSAG